MASLHHGSSADDQFISRLARNIGWLLGGKGFGGVISLFYLAAAARALGPNRFGIFALVLTYAQLIANLIQFQSWKGVIRFGAAHIEAARSERLARLLGFTAILDWTAAVAGCVVAAGGVLLVAPHFSWGAEVEPYAALFAGALLLTTGATPSGMLRLFDRFDLLTYAEASSPVVRFIGAVAVWAIGGGIAAFLAVWVLAALIQTIITWVAAVKIHRAHLSINRQTFSLVLRENPGLWKFMWQASVSSSLGFIWMQGGVLAVGAFAGPAMAGGFRLADRIASAMARPAETLTRALYPELVRLVARDDRRRLHTLFRRTLMVSISAAILLILFCVAEGRFLLRLVGGRAYVFAQPFLVVLAASAAIDLGGLALEPVLNAHGKAAAVLRARIVGALVYVFLLLALVPMVGPIGAAVAAAASCAVMVGKLAFSARKLLLRR